MDFNNKFSANWYKNILSDQDINNKKQHIRNNLNTFIFPYSLKTGFINQTETGYKPANATPSTYADFTKALTGQEGLIAQWDNAIHISSPKVPEVITFDSFHHQIKYKGKVKIKSINDLFKNYASENKKELTLPNLLEWLDNRVLTTNSSIIRIERKEGQESKQYQFIKTPKYSDSDFTPNYDFVNIKKDKDYVIEDSYFSVYMSLDNDSFKSLDYNIFIERLKIDDLPVIDRNKINKSLEFFMTKWFDKERASFFKGYLDISEQETDFTDMPGASFTGDQQQWESVRRFSILTTEEINKDMLFKLYIIPQHSNIGEQFKADDIELFYINNATSYFDNKGRQAYSLVQFASVNDSLATTGQTIQSKIMFGAPGEGYAIPKLIYDKKTGKPIDFEINDKYTPDFGVSSVQIQNFGVAGIIAPVVYGRPIENVGQVNERIYPSRPLLITDLKYPVQDALTALSNPESVFYYGNFFPQIVSNYSDWKEARKAEYTESIVKKFDGWLDVSAGGGKADLITQSNPNSKNLKDKSWTLNGTDTSQSKTNLPVDGYDMRANEYIAVADKKGTILNSSYCERFSPQSHPKCRPVDLLNHSSLLFKIMPSIPLEARQTIPWSLSDIPLIGGFLSKITLGIPIGWRQTSNYDTDLTFPNFRGIPMLISASMYNWYTTSMFSGWGKIPFDPFKHSTNDSVGGIIDSGSQTTAILGNLTDKATIAFWDHSKGENQTPEMIGASTVYLGSYLDYDKGLGDKQGFWTQDSGELPTNEPVKYLDYKPNGEVKYIIDAIGQFAVGKCPVRLTTFMNDPDLYDPFSNINWQATLKSRSMYTDNVRDIQTVYKTSYLNDFIDSSVIFDFPPQPTQPGPTLNYKDIEIGVDTVQNEAWNNAIYYTFLNSDNIDFGIRKYIYEDNGYGDKRITRGNSVRNYRSFLIKSEIDCFTFRKLGFTSLNEILSVYNKIDLSELDINFQELGISTFETDETFKKDFKSEQPINELNVITNNNFKGNSILLSDLINEDIEICFLPNTVIPFKDQVERENVPRPKSSLILSFDKESLTIKMKFSLSFLVGTYYYLYGDEYPQMSYLCNYIKNIINGSVKIIKK